MGDQFLTNLDRATLMSNPPRTIRRDTRFFISAVTRELGSVRKLVKKPVV